MSQPHLVCQGVLKYWIQQEWYSLTAVILANNDSYSLTLTKLSLQSWLSDPSSGVVLDMSLSSVLAAESASVGGRDASFLLLLFTRRSTHVLSALSEQDRIHWQGRLEQIIGEEWKFRVTIPCQQDLMQECQGVLRYNTKRRTIVVTCAQDSRGLPSVLYYWTLKSIKSFGANNDMLVLDTSSSSYYCFNTPLAEEILAVFREATGILPHSDEQANLARNSARFADIERVRKAIERNSKFQSAKRGASSEINRIDEDEIFYEIADDGEDSLTRRSTLKQHSSEPIRSQVDPRGVTQLSRTDELETRQHISNLARLYHFPTEDSRAAHSHMHAVPVMEDKIAQSMANKRNSPLNPAMNPRAVTPQNEHPEPRKVKKHQEKQPSNPESKKKRSRSRNAFRILSGRSTPRPTEDTSHYDPPSRATSPPPSLISRAISKLRGPFRSRENIVGEEGGAVSPRERSRSRQKIISDSKSQFRNLKENRPPRAPATPHSTQSSATAPLHIQQLDRPIPPRHQHIPKHPAQPIIVQHPQPILPLHTSVSPPVVPQPGHFVPTQLSYMNNQVLTPQSQMVPNSPNYPLPIQQFYPNQIVLNPQQAYNYTQMQHNLSPTILEQNAHTQSVQQVVTAPIQNPEENLYNKLGAKQPVQIQSNARMHPHLKIAQTNKQNTPQTNISNVPLVNAPHRIIDTDPPIPRNLSTYVVSPSPASKVTPASGSQLPVHQIAHIPPLLPSDPLTPPNVAACRDDDIIDTDSGNYDHLSPSQVSRNLNNAVFSGLPDILQAAHRPADTSAELSTSPNSRDFKVPPGGQITPLALVNPEQIQQSTKPNAEYRGIRRQDAFRLSNSTSQNKRPPVISPKPIVLFPDRGAGSGQSADGVISADMMDLSGNAEVSRSPQENMFQPQLPPTSPSTLQDPNLSTEC